MRCDKCDRAAIEAGQADIVPYDHVDHWHCDQCDGAILPGMVECAWCGAPA